MATLALDDSGPTAKAALLVVSRSPETSGSGQNIAFRALSPIERRDALANSVVEIRGAGLATGFLWRQPTLVVTCLHSVLGADQITARSGQHVKHVKVSKVFARADLALLESSEAFSSEPIRENVTIS